MLYIITDSTLNLPDNEHLAEKVQSKLNELLNNQNNTISIYDLKTKQLVPYDSNRPLRLQLMGMHLADPAEIQNTRDDYQLNVADTRVLVGEDLTISYKTLYESGFFLLEPKAQEAILNDFPSITLNLDDLFGRQKLRNEMLKTESTNFIDEFKTLLQQDFMQNKTIYYKEGTISTTYQLSSIIENQKIIINNETIENNNNSLSQVENTPNPNSLAGLYDLGDELNMAATCFNIYDEFKSISLLEIIFILKELKNIDTFDFSLFKGFTSGIADKNFYRLDKNSLLYLETIQLFCIDLDPDALDLEHDVESLITLVSQLSNAAPNVRDLTFDCYCWKEYDQDYQRLFSLLEPMKSLKKLTLRRLSHEIFPTMGSFLDKINQLGIQSLNFDSLDFDELCGVPKFNDQTNIPRRHSPVLEVQQTDYLMEDDHQLHLLLAFFKYIVAHFPNLTVDCLKSIYEEIKTVEEGLSNINQNISSSQNNTQQQNTNQNFTQQKSEFQDWLSKSLVPSISPFFEGNRLTKKAKTEKEDPNQNNENNKKPKGP